MDLSLNTEPKIYAVVKKNYNWPGFDFGTALLPA